MPANSEQNFEQSQQAVISLLRRDLLSSQMKNSAYSMRSFARRLGVSHSALSEILRGRRPLTRRAGEKFLSALCIDPEEVKRMTCDLPARHSKKLQSAEKHRTLKASATPFNELRAEQFNAIASWHYFAILSLSETVGFKSDPAWIASRLGLSLSRVKSAIRALVRLNLLQEARGGKLKPTGAQFTTTTDIADLSIRKSHLENLDLQRTSLEVDPVDQRDFSSATFTFSPSQMPLAKKMIQDFRRHFSDTMETAAKEEVYRLSIQLMPLTKGNA